MSIVLKNQLEASARSAEDLEERLPLEHGRALLCYELQDLLRSLVQIFDDLNRHLEMWQDSRDRAIALEAEYEGLYRMLDATCDKAASLVRNMESAGYSVDGRREFLRVARELKGIVCFSRDRTRLATEQIARGEGRALGNVLNELRDHPGA